MLVNIDQAWDRLHTRLRDEQLLVSGEGTTVRMSFAARMKWAAAIALLCICGAAGLYLIPGNKNVQLFTIHNAEVANTLVSTLEDGSIVYLTGGATLTYPERFAADKREVFLQGEALFDIRSNKTSPFRIDTEQALVEVLGTAFTIKSDNKESFELSVQSGTVQVTVKKTDIPVIVQAGETVRLQDNRQLQKVGSIDISQFAQYTEKMYFKDERLGNIVRVINRMSDIPVAFADSSLADREMTITFSGNSPSDMVDLLCLAMNLKRIDNGDEVFIDKK